MHSHILLQSDCDANLGSTNVGAGVFLETRVVKLS